MVAAQQAGQLALNLNLAGHIDLWLVAWVGRIEPYHAIFPPEIFQRCFFVIDQRDHNLAIAGDIGPFHQREIAVENTCVDH